MEIITNGNYFMNDNLKITEITL